VSRWLAPLDAIAGSLSLGARREISNLSPVPLVKRRRDVLEFGRGSGDMLTFMDQHSTDAVVHPIVSRLAESTAGVQWGLWRKSASGRKEDRTPVRSHAVLDLLNHPNQFQSRMHVFEAAQQHFELTGEMSIALGFSPGVALPLDMWVLRPDRIQPVPDPFAFLKGWVYTAPGDAEKIPLETWELLRMVRPSPLDPYRGMGPIQALLRDLDAQKHSKEWQASFFANSARPGGIIEVDRRLGDDEFDEMRERWNEQHRGISKAHRVAIIENGAKWTETAFSLRDMQMAELDTVGRDKALVAFGMPKSMLGIVEDVNRANAEAGEYLFARWMTRPRLERWREMLNHQLMPLYGPRSASGLELDFEDPVPENSEAALAELEKKSAALVTLVGAGFDSDRVLEMLDWPDLGYTAPSPPPIQVPAAVGEPLEIEPGDDAIEDSVDMAMRWVATGHEDGNACEPCLKNQGKLYRNRNSAYADYPGGKGFIKCIGAKYGNDCRCRVVRRRAK
jgi:HK97 family phage portal protein